VQPARVCYTCRQDIFDVFTNVFWCCCVAGHICWCFRCRLYVYVLHVYLYAMMQDIFIYAFSCFRVADQICWCSNCSLSCMCLNMHTYIPDIFNIFISMFWCERYPKYHHIGILGAACSCVCLYMFTYMYKIWNYTCLQICIKYLTYLNMYFDIWCCRSDMMVFW